MPLTVNGTCQYTIHGRAFGREIANVIAMKIDTTGSLDDRNTACYDQCGIIINQWSTQICPLLSNCYSAESVSYIDLDSPTGVVGSRTTSGGNTWPKVGGVSGAPLSTNCAILVRKNINSQRGARKGRMYIGPVAEATTDTTLGNEMTSALQTSWQTTFSSFLANLNQRDTSPVGGGQVYTSQMAVIHITGWLENSEGEKLAPLVGIPLIVQTLSVQKLIATQRRRLRP